MYFRISNTLSLFIIPGIVLTYVPVGDDIWDGFAVPNNRNIQISVCVPIIVTNPILFF